MGKKGNIKIIALYLPQFHETMENNRFWGEGFTDWVTTKKATALFKGHVQPKVPFNENYYDLSKKENIAWQINLAKEYGVYGFGIYHYYFSDTVQTLTRPSEIILQSKGLEMPYFFIWDNGNWKRTWSRLSGNDWAPVEDAGRNSGGSGILLKCILGDKPEWEKHFEYLLPYFQDERYIKVNDCPLFGILGVSGKVLKMEEYWNTLAKECGFNGVRIIYKYNPYLTRGKRLLTYFYEPHHVAWEGYTGIIRRRISNMLGIKQTLGIFDYDKIWRKILTEAEKSNNPNRWLGAFVNYDDTPRRGNKGKLFIGATPEKFKSYFRQLVDIADKQEKEYIFLTAWNEWGEGAYLEPDERNSFDYLKALQEALIV